MTGSLFWIECFTSVFKVASANVSSGHLWVPLEKGEKNMPMWTIISFRLVVFKFYIEKDNNHKMGFNSVTDNSIKQTYKVESFHI